MSANFPSADFSPQLVGYTGQGRFRFWCQKVLPIVYDDSLSYYELLNKVVVYLNNVISDVASCEDNIESLSLAFKLLEEFVNNYTLVVNPATVEEILSKHPEWTTTVQDGAISDRKLTDDLSNYIEHSNMQLSSIVDKVLGMSDVVGVTGRVYSLQGSAYDTKRNRICLFFAPGSAGVGALPMAVLMDDEYNIISRHYYENGGHLSDACYCENLDSYFVTTFNGNGEILQIYAETMNAAGLRYFEGAEYPVYQLSFDNNTNLFYATLDGQNVDNDIEFQTNVYALDFSLVTDYCVQKLNEGATNSYGEIQQTSLQGSLWYNGAFISITWVYRRTNPSIARIWFYVNGNPYMYRDVPMENRYDEPECIFVRDGTLYLCSYENENTLTFYRISISGNSVDVELRKRLTQIENMDKITNVSCEPSANINLTGDSSFRVGNLLFLNLIFTVTTSIANEGLVVRVPGLQLKRAANIYCMNNNGVIQRLRASNDGADIKIATWGYFSSGDTGAYIANFTICLS